MFSSLVVIHIHIPIRLTVKLLKHNVSCVCVRERKRTYGSLRVMGLHDVRHDEVRTLRNVEEISLLHVVRLDLIAGNR